ncbi:MAG: DNA-binding protein [Candidatus Brennerbacteria bacterium CG11_big_fil_rev_8_21_14_0_20_43_10]|uniref:DNA-binding protein n=3 Tax=Candidatus Brenneribacteriota TaxID=1817902 RepID=A0A2M8C2S3_9BACT|nr:MAG: DNA-binding protein [Candidatus Brennerbacteria bacterium CG23_combo_of_CG06-09_8_20_14_all_44_41]PIR25849.1 MAG: DNA-binding protein [Candidatus Brennerbacteria bacterium CG11_big_fil_rev_8_21_14_0_20_43_10]PIX28571.1 MAG: DNA-binding protein [Candidatus Brennerbacteria bacterium CG_4_8_14_3_um_filter_43_14]PJA19638.1 MAG: DNA-binding protein [Candidatus Brennerbacteria bacterium CG_4_10_14_0_2_um_filter_43_14]PJB50384.1 MAG: DNA-binding protein [Candidatus Brennerbacteria bacterium CG
MNKVELANKIADTYKLSKKAGGQIVEMVFGEIMASVKRGQDAAIAGFGAFRVVDRKPRMGVNPKTGEKISIPATRVPKFKPAKAFKDLVKGK